MSKSFEDLLQDCIAELEAGNSLPDVLEVHPDQQAQLEPLLRTALQASQRSLEPDPDAMQRSRTRMLAEAAKLRSAPKRRNLRRWLPRYAIGLAAGLLILIISGYGLYTASAEALPGDLLYPVKLSAESLRLGFTARVNKRISLEETFEKRRMEEVLDLLQERRVELVSFDGTVDQMADREWVVDGIDVRLDDETRILGEIRVADEIEVEGETRPEGFVFAFELHKHLMTLRGVVDRIGSDQWVIGGQNVIVSESSEIKDNISAGDLVLASLVLADDGTLTLLEVELVNQAEEHPASTIDADDDPERMEFSGTVDSIGAAFWIVDGQRIRVDSETDIHEEIAVGDHVTVKAELRGDVLWALDINLNQKSDDGAEEAEDKSSEDGESEETERTEESEDEPEDDEEPEDEEPDEEDEKEPSDT